MRKIIQPILNPITNNLIDLNIILVVKESDYQNLRIGSSDEYNA